MRSRTTPSPSGFGASCYVLLGVMFCGVSLHSPSTPSNRPAKLWGFPMPATPVIPAVMALPDPPRIWPTEGFDPVTVKFDTGFPLNDTNVAIYYSVDSSIEFVSCTGANGERQVSSSFATVVFTETTVVRARTCHAIPSIGQSTVNKVEIVVNPWIGLNPLAIVLVIAWCSALVLLSAATKAKLRGDFTTWYAGLSVLPLLSFSVYLTVNLDLISTGQSANMIVGLIGIGFQLGSGGIGVYIAMRLVDDFVNDDRKMDWWYLNSKGIMKYAIYLCVTGLGLLSTVFTRFMNKEWLSAQFDNDNLTFDGLRRIDRWNLVPLLLADVPCLGCFLSVLTRNDTKNHVPTSVFVGVIIAGVTLVLNGVRCLFGFVNLTPTDPRNKRKGFVGPKGDTMFLKMKARKGGAGAGGDVEGGVDNPLSPAGGKSSARVAPSPIGAAAANAKRGARNKRPEMTAEYIARASRQKFDPLNYSRKLKYGRKLPRFEEMT